MKYELKNWQQNGSVIDNGDGTSKMSVMCWAGIVGDTYGFERTDAFNATLQNDQTIEQQKAAITAQAAAFVANKYPNT